MGVEEGSFLKEAVKHETEVKENMNDNYLAVNAEELASSLIKDGGKKMRAISIEMKQREAVQELYSLLVDAIYSYQLGGNTIEENDCEFWDDPFVGFNWRNMSRCLKNTPIRADYWQRSGSFPYLSRKKSVYNPLH